MVKHMICLVYELWSTNILALLCHCPAISFISSIHSFFCSPQVSSFVEPWFSSYTHSNVQQVSILPIQQNKYLKTPGTLPQFYQWLHLRCHSESLTYSWALHIRWSQWEVTRINNPLWDRQTFSKQSSQRSSNNLCYDSQILCFSKNELLWTC